MLLLLLVLPAGAWYKHVARPRYRAVGRAAGLLVGLRRSPYPWRRAPRASAGPLAWDTPAPGPAARSALGLPSRVPEPWGAPRGRWRLGPPGVHAPRRARVPEPVRRSGFLDVRTSEPRETCFPPCYGPGSKPLSLSPSGSASVLRTTSDPRRRRGV